jgi:hypothetical protein
MRVVVILCSLFLCASCSEPPQKEIDRAQGALDAARAAGAEQYAAAEFTEATTALQQAHDAVTQRDYRLALTRALDANQRAQDSARLAAEGQARVRSEAEVAVHATTIALEQLAERIEAATAARIAASDLKPAQRALTDGRRQLQNARSAMQTGKFLEARTAVQGTADKITAQIDALDEAARSRTARRRR